jgi:hypothetical protein
MVAITEDVPISEARRIAWAADVLWQLVLMINPHSRYDVACALAGEFKRPLDRLVRGAPPAWTTRRRSIRVRRDGTDQL